MLGTPTERFAAIKRMRKWEQGLGGQKVESESKKSLLHAVQLANSLRYLGTTGVLRPFCKKHASMILTSSTHVAQKDHVCKTASHLTPLMWPLLSSVAADLTSGYRSVGLVLSDYSRVTSLKEVRFDTDLHANILHVDVFLLFILQPLPPEDVFTAAAAALIHGGMLHSDWGVGPPPPGKVHNGGHFGLKSYYAPWILADLSLWSHTGITMVRCICIPWCAIPLCADHCVP